MKTLSGDARRTRTYCVEPLEQRRLLAMGWPVQVPRVTQDYATYNGTTVAPNSMHTGIDIGPVNDVYGLHAVDVGSVLFNGANSAYGNYLVINHGNSLYALYAHMAAPSPLGRGAVVAKGQAIGTMGSTGDTGGARHLHFDLMRLATPPTSISAFSDGYDTNYPSATNHVDLKDYVDRWVVTSTTAGLRAYFITVAHSVLDA
jgi:murein DD-endopeptidase MepM/ murein hydrolase activator NlpD